MGVELQSLAENMDTSSSSGKLIFRMFGALAEFERNLIKERTNAGLAAARARGREGGRPKKLNPSKQAFAIKLYKEKKFKKMLSQSLRTKNKNQLEFSFL